MECLEKSQSLAVDSSKDDEWDDACSTSGTISPSDDECSTPRTMTTCGSSRTTTLSNRKVTSPTRRTMSRTPKFGSSADESPSIASTTNTTPKTMSPAIP